MNKSELTFEKDGYEYIIKEKTAQHSAMYRVLVNTEEEARKLFALNSHLVKFIGSINWQWGNKMNTLNLHNLSTQEIQTALETYMWEARKQRVEEYNEQTSSFGFSYDKCCAIPKIKIADTDYELSIQASESHYCSPRENMQEVYDEVEIGFPNFIFSEGFINQYAEEPESPKDTVYGYVPMEELAQEIYLLLNIGI